MKKSVPAKKFSIVNLVLFVLGILNSLNKWTVYTENLNKRAWTKCVYLNV